MSETDIRRRLEQLAQVEPSAEAARRAMDHVRQTLTQAETRRCARAANLWRIVMSSKMARLAVAAAVPLMVVLLWRTVGVASRAYALSDVPNLVRQARTAHMRMRFFQGDKVLPQEYWIDFERGRTYRYWENLASELTHQGQETVTNSTETVFDGRFVMNVNHTKRTVRFERLLASQEEPHRLIMMDRASRGLFTDIEHFDQYVKVDETEIEGQRYDVWRREFRVGDSDVRIRYEYWVSPTTGVVGGMTRWTRHGPSLEWELTMEADPIETDVEPPADTFLTDPPAGYTRENSKPTAEVIGLDLNAFHNTKGHSLRVPASFTLEDGTVLACWCGTHDSMGAGPDEIYEDLVFGGDLPQAPAELSALVSFRDENDPGSLIHYVGRHLMVTRKAGRVYEWALYVPQQEIAVEGLCSVSVALIRLNSPQGNTRTDGWSCRLTSWVVTAQSFAQYVPSAIAELSDAPTVPAEMTYEHLLALARQIRGRPDLYDASQRTVAGDQQHIGVLEPVDPAEITTLEQARQQARGVVQAFYAAIVAGRDADAVKMLRYQEPRASRVVAGMKQLPGVGDIEVADIYATDRSALVITNEFAAYEGRSARWAIGLVKEKGTWLIKDFDPTTTERMQEEIAEYLQVFPGAQHFPEE